MVKNRQCFQGVYFALGTDIERGESWLGTEGLSLNCEWVVNLPSLEATENLL